MYVAAAVQKCHFDLAIAENEVAVVPTPSSNPTDLVQVVDSIVEEEAVVVGIADIAVLDSIDHVVADPIAEVEEAVRSYRSCGWAVGSWPVGYSHCIHLVGHSNRLTDDPADILVDSHCAGAAVKSDQPHRIDQLLENRQVQILRSCNRPHF